MRSIRASSKIFWRAWISNSNGVSSLLDRLASFYFSWIKKSMALKLLLAYLYVLFSELYGLVLVAPLGRPVSHVVGSVPCKSANKALGPGSAWDRS